MRWVRSSPCATSSAACSRWPGCAATASSAHLAATVAGGGRGAGRGAAGRRTPTRDGHRRAGAGRRRPAGQRVPDDGPDDRAHRWPPGCSGWSPSGCAPHGQAPNGRAPSGRSRTTGGRRRTSRSALGAGPLRTQLLGSENVRVSSAAVTSSTSPNPRSGEVRRARRGPAPRAPRRRWSRPTVRTPSSQPRRSRRRSRPVGGLGAGLDSATSTSRTEFDEFAEPTTMHQVAPRRHLLHRDLAVLGGVADVVAGRVLQRAGTARAARAPCPSSRRPTAWSATATPPCPGRAPSTAATSAGSFTSWMCSGASPAVPSTSSWPVVADEQDVEVLARRTARPPVHLGDQRAGRVDRLQPAVARPRACTAGDTPCAENTTQRALGHLVGLVDEDRAALAQLGHDVHVVHDLLAHVDRRAVAARAPSRPRSTARSTPAQ